MVHKKSWDLAYIALSFMLLVAFEPLLAQGKEDCEFLLTSDLTRSLQERIARGYPVEILQKPLNGKNKTLVLIGTDASPMSSIYNLVESFAHIGIGHGAPVMTIGEKLSERISSFLGRISSLIRAFVIPDINITYDGKRLKKLYTRLENEFKKIENELEKKRAGQDSLQLEVDPIPIKGVQYEAKEEKIKEIFNLEKGLVPTLMENLISMEFYVVSGAILTGIALSSIFHTISLSACLAGAEVIMAYSICRLIGNYIEFNMFLGKDAKPWYQRWFPIEMAKIRNRDKTMAKNIGRILESRQEVSELLAVVRNPHVHGIKERLVRDGYSSIPVPSPSLNPMTTQDGLGQDGLGIVTP